MAFCPPGMDRPALDGLVSSMNLLTQSIQQLGIAVIPVAFIPECCRIATTKFRTDKDLQDDKDGIRQLLWANATAMSSI